MCPQEHDSMDTCLSRPCRHGGRCVNRNGTYRCLCPPQYKGADCSEAGKPCNKSHCHNNGHCYVSQLVCVHMCVWVCICVCICVYVCAYVCAYVCMCVHMCVCVCICVCICVYVCVSVCVASRTQLMCCSIACIFKIEIATT